MEKPKNKFTSFFDNNAPKHDDAKVLVAQLKQEIRRELDVMKRQIKTLEDTIRRMKDEQS